MAYNSVVRILTKTDYLPYFLKEVMVSDGEVRAPVNNTVDMSSE